MKRMLIIHYGEIGLKGANKDYFIRKLIKSIKIRLEKKFRSTYSVKYTIGRIMVDLPEKVNEKGHQEILDKIFGIKSYKFVYVGSLNIEKLEKQIAENFPKFEKNPLNFRIKVKRSMNMDKKSFEIERDIGAYILKNKLDVPVKLKCPEFTIDIEFFNQKGYFSFKTYKGLAGMPSNSQGKLISLISSGIDSPVASFQMMRRGARVIFVSFNGYPYTDKEEKNQVKELVKILGKYQFDTKLYQIPFGEIQRSIAKNTKVPAKIRTVIYRRLMLRVAEKIAKKEQAKGIITGDNYGQVASQTPENIFTIHEASNIPVFQPLISFDKEDVIKIAEKIGTFEISKLPCKDSCSLFMPKNPVLKANIYDTKKHEENLPIDEFVDKALKDSEINTFS